MRRLGLTETTRFDHPRIPPGDPLRPQVAHHGTRPAASKLPMIMGQSQQGAHSSPAANAVALQR